MNTLPEASWTSDPHDNNNTGKPKSSDKYNSLINILRGREEFVLDANGVIISSNLEAVNITGYEEHEVIGQPISLFYTQEEKLKAFAHLDKAVRFGQCIVTGFRLKKRASPFWAKMKISALRDEQGALSGFNVVMYDSTHRAISNEKIQTLKDEYLNIFNNPFVGTFKFKASDYVILQCNPLALKIIGRNNSDGLLFSDIFAAKTELADFLEILFREKKVDGFRFQINDKNNGSHWGVFSARYFEAKGFIEGTILDISNQHNQLIELERLNSHLDNFTYHASHDLRSPLTTVMGLINLARLEPSTVFESLSMIEDRVHYLDRLLKDLGTVSFNSTSPVQSVEFDFKKELEMLVKQWSISHKSIQVETHFELGAQFYTDPTRMAMILRNLISNAYEYQMPHSQGHKIKIRVKVYPTHVAIKVQDNGIGIEWSLKDKVWDMFFKGTTRSSGSGLGLYIVKLMVEKLRGRIYVESTVEHGTTFLLTVPNSVNNF
jgi:PAS domain S-box-containing protein